MSGEDELDEALDVGPQAGVDDPAIEGELEQEQAPATEEIAETPEAEADRLAEEADVAQINALSDKAFGEFIEGERQAEAEELSEDERLADLLAADPKTDSEVRQDFLDEQQRAEVEQYRDYLAGVRAADDAARAGALERFQTPNEDVESDVPEPNAFERMSPAEWDRLMQAVDGQHVEHWENADTVRSALAEYGPRAAENDSEAG